MKFNICFKRLIIFSIATLMCLSIIAFIPTSAINDTYENSDLYMPLLPDMKGVITSNQANIYPMSLSNALVAGANYIVHAQADITEDNAGNGDPDIDFEDGGWDWYLTAPTFTHSAIVSWKNLYGATAQGLYYAYLETSDASYMTAMTDAANFMIGDAGIRSAADLVFLMLYDDLPSVAGTTYQDSARTKYDARITTYVSAQALAEYIRDVRGASYPNGIIAWDIGAWARAAAMLDVRYPGNGYDTDADDIAEVIYQDSFMLNPGYFDIYSDNGWDPTWSTVDYWWYTLGITGLIDAFDEAQVHISEIPILISILQACQFPSGAFSGSYGANPTDEDWQSTAYAVMTLARYDQATYQQEINDAFCWLAATQDPASGGWVYSSGNHYPEIGGECTAALYFANGPVKNIDSGEVFCSIQAAIDDAETLNGHTIQVQPGTYDGNIIVYKDDLTIESIASASTTIIDASNIDYSTYKNVWGHGINYAWAETYDPGLLKNGFMIWSDGVTIDGFKIINADFSSSYNRGIGVLIGSIHTTYAGFIPWNIDQWGGLISPVDEPTPTGVIIKNNIIDGASDGVYNWMSNGNTIEYNIIKNTVSLGGHGIQCYEGGTDNIIRGNSMDNIAGAGVSICGAWPNYLLDCSNTLVYGNTVTNSNWGIQFYNMGGSGVEAYNNNLLNNNRGLVVEGAGDATVGIAYENNLVGNSQYGIINTCPTGTFIATCNWWGDSSGPTHTSNPLGCGIGDSVSDFVDYSPWLDASYPGGSCIGGACQMLTYVDDDYGCSTPGWNIDHFATIQDGVDRVCDGGTVTVYDGIYDPFIVEGRNDITIQAGSNPIITGNQLVWDMSYPTQVNNIIFVNNSVNIYITGFDIIGTNPGGRDFTVFYQASSGTIEDCLINPDNVGNMAALAVRAITSSDLTVETCELMNYGRIGIYAKDDTILNVYNSDLHGTTYDLNMGDFVNYGIEVEGVNNPCTSEIKYNSIYNHDFDETYGSPSWSSAGIIVDTWRYYGPDYNCQESTVTIECNEIINNWIGVEIVPNPNIHVNLNDIYDNKYEGALSSPYYDGTQYLYNTLDAECNWWGSHDGPSTSYPNNVSDYVDYEPFIFVDADIGGPYGPQYGIAEGIEFDPSGSTYSCGTVSYHWNFGDGHTSTEMNPTHYFTVSGTYTVTLTITLETTCGFTYTDYDITTIEVYVGCPDVWMIYPEGGEILEDTVTVRWYAFDDDVHWEDLKIYLYYSTNNGMSWRKMSGELHNSINKSYGVYEWDTNDYADGTYKLRVEAVNDKGSFDMVAADTSELFTVANGELGTKVSDVQILDTTIDSILWVKDGDNLEITAGITGLTSINKEDITADLSSFGMGSEVTAESFDGFTATWTINDITCTPNNGEITVAVTADESTKLGTITADNTKPEVELIKPKNGLYLFNLRILPLLKTVIFGEINIEFDGTDNSGIWKAEYYINDDLIFTSDEDPFNWFMDMKLMGQETVLKVIIYDKAGNSNSVSKEMTVYNFFGN